MQFKYIATTEEGKYHKGYKKAKSAEELIKTLKSENLFCISYRETLKFKSFNKTASHKDIALFCKYMNTSLKSGMNICDIFDLVSYQFSNKSLCRDISRIKEYIESGNTFTEALNNFPKLFPVFFREMVYVGEESGRLQEVFFNMEKYYNSSHKRNKKAVSSLIYPLLVFLLTLIIAFIMITRILPQFILHLVNIQGELPAITKFYLTIGSFLNSYGYLAIPISILFFIGFCFIWSKCLNSKDLSFLIIKIPIVSRIYKKYFYARFSYSMYVLIQSGIDIISCLTMIIKCEKNKWFIQKLLHCSKNIQSGQSIYSSLLSTEIFPSFFTAMIHIGEENGNLDSMLKTASEIFEDDLNTSLERLAVLIEPILILILGAFVGTVVFAIMMPIFKLSTGGF